MIELKPNALYSRSDLAEMLAPAGVDVDHFVARLQPRKVFKQLYYGADLLRALDTAPSLAERPEGAAMPAAANRGNRKRRGSARGEQPGAKLDAYIQKLKGQRS